ncbi:MAG: bifunctional aspartate kinase/homoserine dehydrogenase I, partial [Bacteroidota bacterium]
MKTLKFGGTSVKDAEMMSRVTEIVKNSNEEQIVVVSAMGGATDFLLRAAEKAHLGNSEYKEDFKAFQIRHEEAIDQLFGSEKALALKDEVVQFLEELDNLFNGIFLTRDISAKTKDRIVSMGELLSSKIIAQNLIENNIDAVWLDSRELIRTDSTFGNARVDIEETYSNIKFKVKGHQVFVAPGFIARDAAGEASTLGRGGSDYSAALYAAALDAEVLEIWTDVSGMMTADPRK